MSLSQLAVVGTSHAAAPVAFREALAMSRADIRAILGSVGSFAPSVREATILATCTRTEFYLVATDAAATQRVRAHLVARAEESDARTGDWLYATRGDEAVHHLFRVAAGLDSIVVGEGQILSQVKEARRAIVAIGTGGILHHMFDAAIRAGKCVRAETEIGRGSVSVAAAAVEMLERELHGLGERTVLVLGTGETGSTAARLLKKKRPRSLILVNRTRRTAEELARSLGADSAPLRKLADVLEHCDAVVCATSAAEPILVPELLERVQRVRSGRPLVLADIANPRDVHPDAASIKGIRLRDLDHLRSRAERNLRSRRQSIPKAERVLERELERFREWSDGRRVVPTVRALRKAFQEVGEEVIEAEVSRFGEAHREAMSRCTRALLNKLLHTPTVKLKSLDPTADRDAATLDALHELFDLGEAIDATNGNERPTA